MDAKQIKLGLIGYGVVGSSIGSGIRDRGLTSVAAYDIAALEGPYSRLMQTRARDAGVNLVASPAELAEYADSIIAVVPGTESVNAAAAIAPYLDARHLYVDIASATPRVKQAVGSALAASGAQVADGGIMRLPKSGPRHELVIAASGPAVQRFHDELVPWGMKITVIGTQLGAGSGMKIIRSVAMKGIEAVLVECAVGSERYGIQDAIVKSIAGWFEGRTFMDWYADLVTTDVIHAERRCHEAEMSAEALDEAGLDPIMTRATAARLRSIAELGLKEHFGGKVPSDPKVAVKAVNERLGGKTVVASNLRNMP